MKKLILVLCFILFVYSSAVAGMNDIKCVSGNYEGWHVWYEQKSSLEQNALFHFDNETGVAAFSVTAIIDFLDFHGDSLGRLEKRYPGPIRKYIRLEGKIPKNTSKISCDIYWSDEYNSVNIETKGTAE